MSGTTQYNNPLLQGKTYDDAKWNTVLPVPYGMTAWGSVQTTTVAMQDGGSSSIHAC